MKRSAIIKKHFLNPKRFLRKFIPFVGQIEFVLSVISFVIGKDVDVFEEFYAQIPVVGRFIADGDSSDGGSYIDENGQIRTDGGINRRRRRGAQVNVSGSGLKKIIMIGFPIVAVIALVGGSGYMALASNQLGGQLAGTNIPSIGDDLAQLGKTVECGLDAACVKEWQFENSERPGSEEVGQEFRLQIEDFAVNGGSPLDVADRRPNDRVPADFSVYNPINGLKGIKAENVAYRIRVYDGIGSLTGAPECQTGWNPLGGQFTEDEVGGNGTIMPNDFATPLGSNSELTIENCKLLQPALGIQRAVRLQLAYDYSSQSTLQVQAMSEEHRRSIDERPDFEPSQTADTPVKTYIEVESPITYRSNEDGTSESSIFGVRLGFETGQDAVKYRVNTTEFEFYDSSQTIDVGNAESVENDLVTCEGIRRVEGDLYKFSENKEEYFERRQSRTWFDEESDPTPARCSMVLEDPSSISPTGETLTFRVDANYTVMLEETVEGFEIENSRCADERFECPMLVPQSHENAGNGELISECDTGKRVSANNGCGARLGQDWRNLVGDYAIDETIDSIIENGETAYRLNRFLREQLDKPSSYIDSSIDDQTVIGLEPDIVRDLKGDQAYAALTSVDTETDGQDVEYQEIDRVLCSNDDATQEDFRDKWEDNHQGDILYFNQPPSQDCAEETIADFVLEWYTWSLYESPQEEFNKVQDGCNGAVVISGRGLECYT